MAGMAAAWALTDPAVRDELDVCVIERAPHLGGKSASTRGVNGRIEEHGLHVWLGYYDNAFRLIREVYDELERPESDPACPLATWQDAFAPGDLVGVEDWRDGSWSHWVAAFSRNDAEPGSGRSAGGPLSVATFVRRGLGLLLDFSQSLQHGSAAPPPAARGAFLSGSPDPPRGGDPMGELDTLLRRAEIAALVGAVESIRLLRTAVPEGGSLASLVLGSLERMRADLLGRLGDADGRRSAELADLVTSTLLGAIRDGLLTTSAGFSAIDELDFREWLAAHGARPETLESPLIRGMYDLVFAYEDGDAARPRFPAGLGLFLSGKLFFEYHGSIFWRLQAGMGDVVFAPLYQALRARGVAFRLGHHVEHLRLSRDRRRVETIAIARDGDPGPACDPLVRVGGLPCFPSIAQPRRTAAHGPERLELMAGHDFDDVILAVSVGAIRALGPELLGDSAGWRAMVEGLATVPTQSLQLWLGEDERALGWPYPGATVSGYVKPFDTYASMSHLIARERWPASNSPRAIAYLCSVLPSADATDPVIADRVVRSNAEQFLVRDAGHLWPGAVAPDGGFRWELLCGAGTATGASRLDGQYRRANIDPSDRYVQSLPGTDTLRLRADASGYENLFLAGDWIDCGLNAGCIEAAVIAGIQAANAVQGRPRCAGVVGSWLEREAA